MAATAQTGTGNVTTVAVTTGTSIVLNKPSNLADGDLLVAAICLRNNTSDFTTLPTGFVAVAPSGTEIANVGTPRFYYKPISNAAGEPSTYTWSGGTSSSRGAAVMTRVTGADLNSILDTAGSEGSGITDGAGGTTLTMGAATPVGGGDLLLGLAVAHISTGGTRGFYAGPSGVTLVGSSGTSTAASETDLSMHQQVLTTSGNTGTRVYTRNGAVASAVGYHMAIKSLLTASIAQDKTTGAIAGGSGSGGTVVTYTVAGQGGNGNTKTYAIKIEFSANGTYSDVTTATDTRGTYQASPTFTYTPTATGKYRATGYVQQP